MARKNPIDPDDIKHGTLTAYNTHGCRCGQCTAYAADRFKANRARARDSRRMGSDGHYFNPAATHGTESGYVYYGCHCPPCRAAGSTANQKWKRNRP